MLSTPVDSVVVRVSIDSLLEGVQIIGFDWRYLYLNATALSHGQRRLEELLGQTMTACYPGIEQTPLFLVLDRVMRGRCAERFLNEFHYGEGKSRWFELLIQPVPDGICVLSLDITDRRLGEQRLHQAQKSEAVGQLAGGVAHDFNNVLTAILGYATLIRDREGLDATISADVEEIILGAQRATALTRQLLAFGRQQDMRPVALSLNAVVEGIEPMLRRLIPENIGIKTSLQTATYGVLADPTQLEQVLLNLVVNARDAMPDGGVVTIATQNATLDEDAALAHAETRAGDYAVLTVTDTGAGMTLDVQARIFEPFYTTKALGRGTGLGLAVVHGIIKQLGGNIWVYSEPDRGTVFKIYFPRTDAATSSRGARTCTPTALVQGHDRILLVEDDDGVRAFARRILERQGYRVSEADSGEAALASLAETKTVPDLLVTDVTLPGMNGFQLARHLCEIGEACPVVFVSGYANPPDLDNIAAQVVEKPFTAEALLTRVRNVLSHRV